MRTEIKLPELGENITAADVVKILVSEGDAIAKDQPLLELETNKASLELPASAGGRVSKILVKAGDEVKVGQVLMNLEGEAADSGAEKGEAAKKEGPEERRETRNEVNEPAAAPGAAPDSGPPAAPQARKAAREAGADITQVPGTGPRGRVSKDDVARYAESMKNPSASASFQLPEFKKWGPVRREKMTNVRRTTAQHLTQCWTQIPHVTQFDRADITRLEDIRKRYADKAAQAGGNLTMAVMVVKVAAAALKVFPKFNASVDMGSHEIIFKDYINVGIAVATERGLMVPVLRDTGRKNMIEIAVEVSQLAQRTREGKLRLEDMQGGTFTVTNLGNIGGTHFTPIINWPEVAILGMGRAQMEAGFEEGVCKPKVYLPLSLSYDHRVIDGVEGIRFLRWIVDAIEEPLLLSLEG